MLSFLQIQQEVFNKLKEEKGTDEFWTEQEVKDSLNDTYYDIAFDCKCFRRENIIVIVAGIRKYKLPVDYVVGSLNIVEYDNKEIYPATYEEIISMYGRNWRDVEGDPVYYILGMDSDDEIDLVPKPDTNGNKYNLPSDTQNEGVIVAIGDDAYEEFTKEVGTLVDSDGNVVIKGNYGAVVAVHDPTNNLRIHYAKYPKRLFKDKEVFLPPLFTNPKRILNKGALADLFEKDGYGKDIAKASYYNKRYEEAKLLLNRKNRMPRTHKVRSITEGSLNIANNRGLNLGDHYPTYFKR